MIDHDLYTMTIGKDGAFPSPWGYPKRIDGFWKRENPSFEMDDDWGISCRHISHKSWPRSIPFTKRWVISLLTDFLGHYDHDNKHYDSCATRDYPIFLTFILILDNSNLS